MTIALAPSSARHVDAAVAVRRDGKERWPWLLAAVAFVGYIVVAWHVVHGLGYEIGDAISRTAAASHVVTSRDPHLAAMGFYWMPLPTLSQIPAVLALSPLHQAQFAGPATSALWAALAIPVLAAIGRHNRAPRWVSVLICVVYAASPVVVWAASDGMSEASSFFFLTLIVFAYSGWRRAQRPSDLVVLGLALAGEMLCRYEAIPVTIAVAVVTAVVLPRERWVRTVLMVVLPAGYTFVLWLTASYLIVKDPFYWFKELNRIAKVSGTGALLYKTTGSHLTNVAAFTLAFLALFALLALVLLPLCVRRGWRATVGSLGLVAPAFVFPALLASQMVRGNAPGAARYFYPCWVVAAGAGLALAGDPATRRWVVRTRRGLIGAAAVATASIQLLAFANPRVSNVENEGVLFAPIVGRAAPTPPDAAGWDAGYAEWRQLFATADPLLGAGARLLLDTDTAPQAVLFTAHPRRLVIPEDRDFEQILAAPVGRVELVALPAAVGQRGSRYYASIAALVAPGATSHWQRVGAFGSLDLYRYLP